MKKKINTRLIIILSLLIISIIISILIYQKQVLNIDILAYHILVEKLRNPHLTNIMKFITNLGNSSTVILFCLISSFFIFIKNKQLGLIVPLNLVIITVLNQIIKLIIKRPRPSGYRLITIGGYSFPSGHAMVSLAFYGIYLYLIQKTIKNKIAKTILTTLTIIIIISIGISRIYLGVHYFSDVLVGYCISLIYLLSITKLLDKYILK